MLAATLAPIRFEHVSTSPLQRASARQTCALAGLGDAAEITPDFPSAIPDGTTATMKAGGPATSV